MKRFGLPACPYCGLKIGPVRTWILKSQGEYQCIRCGGISNIVLHPAVSFLAAAAILISILIFMFFRFLVGEITLESIGYMMIPYVIFFLISVFMVKLKRPIVRSKMPAPPNPNRPPRRPPSPPAQSARKEINLDHTCLLYTSDAADE